MITNFILFLSFYTIIIFSTLGYGIFFYRFIGGKYININIGYAGLTGIFFLILYSYLSHIFLSHSYLHNSILIFLGFILLINYLFKIKEKFFIYLFLITFAILFISSLIFKTHDDFSYYHFAYTYLITQKSALIGIGQFNHGFRTPSSIFYLSSLFYLPTIKYFMFYMSPILILGFSNLVLLTKIIKNFKEKKTSFITYLCLLSFIFINIFFYRIQEHGTDRSAQILIFLLFVELLIFVNFNKDFTKNTNNILLLLGLVISLKAFYVLYIIFFLPILYLLIKEKKTSIIFEVIKSKIFIFFLILFTLILFTNFINTGCLIYPVRFTCFENFDWTISLVEVSKMNDWYEQWSKAGATPNFRVKNPEIYIQNFNWISNWINLYFFNKVFDFILGLTFLIFVVFSFFYSGKSKKINYNKNYFLIYITLFILLFEWFYNHPALRYGGYCLIALCSFFPFSIFLEKFKISNEKMKKGFISLILITIIIFTGRNIHRINQEVKKYNYKPISSTYYRIDRGHFIFDELFDKIINNHEDCLKGNKTCLNDSDYKIKKFFNTYIFINKK